LWIWHEKCILCGRCLIACPEKAIVTDENLKRKIIRKKCSLCGYCIEICPQKAYEFIGYQISVTDVVKEVLKDRIFFDRSGGGVTISGGEPLLQYEFTLALLKTFKKHHINTAIETSGYASWEVYKKVAEHADVILQDIKVIDNDKHMHYTGVSNTIILSNIKKMDKQGKKIIIRVPIIPKINDKITDVNLLGEWLSTLKNTNEVHLLPYHRLGEPKYERLQLPYSKLLKGIPTQKEESVLWIKSILATKYNLQVHIGG